MLDARDTDGASGPNAILFVGGGTPFELHAYRYDPVADDVIGAWRHMLVLGHWPDDDDGDSEDPEGPCCPAVDHCLGYLPPQDPRVFHRNECGSNCRRSNASEGDRRAAGLLGPGVSFTAIAA